MKDIIFIGTSFKKGRGGIASVLKEYNKLFPNSYFIASTDSKDILNNLITFSLGLIKFIWLLLFNKNIKIIHIHGASYKSFYRKYIFYILSKLFSKIIIYHIHGGKFHEFYRDSGLITKKMIISMLTQVDCIICLSEKWRDFYSSNFDLKKIVIIPNIVAKPSISESHIETKKSSFQFLYLGNISEQKGIWLLLESLHMIKSKIQGKAIFQLGGNGEIATLKKLISKYRLEDVVEYIGWVTNENKEKYLQDADVFILPSYSEGLPISILEAMAYKKAVISTNVGGIPEIIESGENGILVTPGSKNQLIDAILFSIHNHNLIKEYGERSIETVKRYFPDNVKKELLVLYTNLRIKKSELSE